MRPYCAVCRSPEWPLSQTLAALTYAYPWIEPIKQFKFQEHTGWAHSFADLMRRNCALVQCLEAADQVVPMPLSDARMRSRGFNPALLLARALCPTQINTCLLARPRDTPAQSTLGRNQRWHNVQDAYQVIDASAVAQSQCIVLVDDVMTTGASLCAAANTLRKAGAKEVCAVVLARAE
jgi:ComF family protein